MSLPANPSLLEWLSFSTPPLGKQTSINSKLSFDSYTSTTDGNSSQDEIPVQTNYANFNYSRWTPNSSPMKGEQPLESVKQKMKTEICKNYLMTQSCPYGDKCLFAHGKSELRQKTTVPKNYKTVKCRQFHNEMHCDFGPRCQFIHKNAKKNPKRYALRVTYRVLYQLMQLRYDEQEFEEKNIEKLFQNMLDAKTFKRQRLDVFTSLQDYGVGQ